MTSVLSKEGQEFESQKSLEMCIAVERLILMGRICGGIVFLNKWREFNKSIITAIIC